MTSADVFEQIEKMGELPSLPQSLLQIQKVATDDRSSAADLAECILQDQALTMRVLKVVNSAMYQRRNKEKVRTVQRSVIVMGFETVRKLALGLSVFDMMSKLSRSPWLVSIAQHSLITAAFAQILAEASGTVAPEEAFVTALIHDVGKVVLLECSPQAMDLVLADQENGVSVIEAERKHFGITHDRAGRRLASRWQLPHELQNVIGDHHDIDPLSPPKHLDPVLGVIVYADAMSHFKCDEESRETEFKIMRKAGRALGISTSAMESIYERVENEIQDLAGCMGIELGDLKEYGVVVNAGGRVNVAPQAMSEQELGLRTAKQLELYQTIGRGLSTGRDADQLLQIILEGVVGVLGFERTVLLRVDRTNGQLKVWHSAGIDADKLAPKLELPLKRSTGALALAVLEHRSFHVPMANSNAYGDLVGSELLAAAQCSGFSAAPVVTPEGVVGVLYADCGSGGDDIAAEQTTELNGLALQIALIGR